MKCNIEKSVKPRILTVKYRLNQILALERETNKSLTAYIQEYIQSEPCIEKMVQLVKYGVPNNSEDVAITNIETAINSGLDITEAYYTVLEELDRDVSLKYMGIPLNIFEIRKKLIDEKFEELDKLVESDIDYDPPDETDSTDKSESSSDIKVLD